MPFSYRYHKKKKSCFRAAPPVRKQLVLHSKYLEGMPEPALVNEMYEQCFPHSADTTEKNFLTSNNHLWTGMEKAQNKAMKIVHKI